jgi:hypothetical protein
MNSFRLRFDIQLHLFLVYTWVRVDSDRLHQLVMDVLVVYLRLYRDRLTIILYRLQIVKSNVELRLTAVMFAFCGLCLMLIRVHTYMKSRTIEAHGLG